MPAPATVDEFIDLVRKSGIVDEKRLDPHLTKLRSSKTLPKEPGKLAGIMVRDGVLTQFQAEQLMMGKWRRFTIGKYKVLERLGSGGMGSVYLCEHKLMRRRVAVKVLPTAKAKDESSLERFYREARAVAALDHPNIVHAYDIDQDGELHFLVMEFVDGASLQEIVKRSGRLEPIRAAHYVYQAALGLDHAQAKGIVHRDIKPGNLLVDRSGTLKILDMGLARFFNDEEDDLTRKFDENVLGTADYLAPEQAVDSHEADTRADIYSLGATFYFMLTSKTPFGEGSVAQKLIWHQTRKPETVTAFRDDVPDGVLAVLDKMMAKDPADRHQNPAELAEALYPFVQQPIDPPTEQEMPRFSLAAVGPSVSENTQTGSSQRTTPNSPSSKKSWQISSANHPTSAPPAAKAPPPAPPSSSQTSPRSPTPAPSGPSRTAPNSTPAPSSPEPERQTVANSAPVQTAQTAPTQEQSVQPEIRKPHPPLPEKQATHDPNTPYWANVQTTEEEEAPPPQFAPMSAGKPVLSSNHTMLLIGVGVLCLLTVLIIGGWWLFFGGSDEVGSGRLPLKVMRGKTGKGIYNSIQSALRDAEAGDVIELHDSRYEENVSFGLQGSKSTNVTLRAAPNVDVVWTYEGDHYDRPILQLVEAANFKLEGDRILFDGRGKCSPIILMAYLSDGLTLKNVRVTGFTDYAVKIKNCDVRNTAHPVVIDHLNVIGGTDASKAIIFFDAKDNAKVAFNDHIHILNPEFGGMPLNRAIQRMNNTVTGNEIRLPNGFVWKDAPIEPIRPNKKKNNNNNKKNSSKKKNDSGNNSKKK